MKLRTEIRGSTRDVLALMELYSELSSEQKRLFGALPKLYAKLKKEIDALAAEVATLKNARR